MLTAKESPFLPAPLLSAISEVIVMCNLTSMSELVRDLVLTVLTQEESLNQLRFSLCFQIEGFGGMYNELVENGETVVRETTEAPSSLGARVANLLIGGNVENPLFTHKEDAWAGGMFSIHMNAKELNAENHDQATVKSSSTLQHRRRTTLRDRPKKTPTCTTLQRTCPRLP